MLQLLFDGIQHLLGLVGHHLVEVTNADIDIGPVEAEARIVRTIDID